MRRMQPWWSREWQDWLTLPLVWQVAAANAVAALASLMLGWAVGLPAWQAWQQAKVQGEQLTRQWQAAQATRVAQPRAARQPAPAPTDVWALLPHLLRLSQRAGVTLQQVQSTPPAQDSGARLDVTVLGTARGWQQMLQGLAQLAPAVDVVTMRVDPAERDLGNALQWQLQLVWSTRGVASDGVRRHEQVPVAGLFGFNSAAPEGRAGHLIYTGWIAASGRAPVALGQRNGQPWVWRVGDARVDGCVLRQVLPTRLEWAAGARPCAATPRQSAGDRP